MEIVSTLILGGFGICITLYYSWRSKKLADDQMMKELFTEFNRRYDDLNDDLQIVHDKYPTSDELEKAENYAYLKNKIIDFFNLCAEEYFWHKKGRIDDDIWISWNTGMKFWYKVKSIKDLWQEEIKDRGLISYYITNKKDFFQ
ncbi:MAG: hypothetical protein WAU36_18930 [Cyclobacteriaceae bacterium]